MTNKAWQELYENKPKLQQEFGNWRALKAFMGRYDFKRHETQKIIDCHKKIRQRQLSRFELIEKRLMAQEERIKKLEDINYKVKKVNKNGRK